MYLITQCICLVDNIYAVYVIFVNYFCCNMNLYIYTHTDVAVECTSRVIQMFQYNVRVKLYRCCSRMYEKSYTDVTVECTSKVIQMLQYNVRVELHRCYSRMYE